MYILVVGTRPDVIKMAPIYREMKRRKIPCKVLRIGQHTNLIDNLLNLLGIKTDYTIFLYGNNVPSKTADLMNQLERYWELEKNSPEKRVVVYGDTYSAYATALSAYLHKYPLIHVEAGLRSGNPDRPFPEETLRRMISVMADWHFCPSGVERENLIKERVTGKKFIVGNTVIDEVDHWTLANAPPVGNEVLVTLHRTENQEFVISEALGVIGGISLRYPDTKFTLFLHPNPNVVKAVERASGSTELNIEAPLDYPDFIARLAEAKGVITDSGGIQEEAAYLGVPTLVLREETERPLVLQGSVRLSPVEELDDFYFHWINQQNGRDSYKAFNRYGRGVAADNIVSILESNL